MLQNIGYEVVTWS